MRSVTEAPGVVAEWTHCPYCDEELSGGCLCPETEAQALYEYLREARHAD